nr:MAG TPA: hypothetical protein [Caudoviricetes sp.]
MYSSPSAVHNTCKRRTPSKTVKYSKTSCMALSIGKVMVT